MPGSAPEPGSSGPSVFTAVQEQLGLKLDSPKAPADVLVIDHVERPSEKLAPQWVFGNPETTISTVYKHPVAHLGSSVPACSAAM
jgi:hypothetical protein